MRHPDSHMTDWLCAEFQRRRSAYAVRQWMDASSGTPDMQESSSNISSRKQSISNQKRYDETRVLTLRTRRISNLLSSLPIKISAFQCAVYAINVSLTNVFPPESRETPFNIYHSNTIWRVERSPYISPIAAPVWLSSTHNLVTWGIPFALHEERRTTMLNEVAHLVWVPYVHLWLPPTWWITNF